MCEAESFKLLRLLITDDGRAASVKLQELFLIVLTLTYMSMILLGHDLVCHCK